MRRFRCRHIYARMFSPAYVWDVVMKQRSITEHPTVMFSVSCECFREVNIAFECSYA